MLNHTENAELARVDKFAEMTTKAAVCPVTHPHDIKQLIRQALLASGWTQEPAFDGYAEEYLW